MKTQLKGKQRWESLRKAAEKINQENGEKMVVQFCGNKYIMIKQQHGIVRWYEGFIDEKTAANFMKKNGCGLKFFILVIDPLLRVCIIKETVHGVAEAVYIDENLITIL